MTRDRRRSDGLTLNLWYRGRGLVWDATVVDTFAESHYIVSAAMPGSIGVRGGDRVAAVPPGLKNFRASASCSKILNDKIYFNTVRNSRATLFFRASGSCSKILNN